MPERSADASRPFLEWLARWKGDLPSASMRAILQEAGGPGHVCVAATDLVNGFCTEGPLASARVGAIVPACADLLVTAHSAGVRHFLMTRDAHASDAEEFGAWPAHCVAGSEESELVSEIRDLPFADTFRIFDKNTLSALEGTGLSGALEEMPNLRAVVCIGDCTDLCVYQLAMGLRLRANARGEPLRVIVPADCVDTYDVPVDVADRIGALPHDADLLHALFLYHLALCGCDVVATVTD